MSGNEMEKNPLVRGLDFLADLVYLNFLTLVCSLGLVTIGPALTAMYAVLEGVVSEKEGYVGETFFMAFRKSFKPAAILWLFFVLAAALLTADLLVTARGFSGLPKITNLPVGAALFFLFLTATYFFPLLSHFGGGARQTAGNAVRFMLLFFPKSLLMLVIALVPLAAYFYAGPIILPLILLFGCSGPGCLIAFLCRGMWKRFEGKGE